MTSEQTLEASTPKHVMQELTETIQSGFSKKYQVHQLDGWSLDKDNRVTHVFQKVHLQVFSSIVDFESFVEELATGFLDENFLLYKNAAALFGAKHYVLVHSEVPRQKIMVLEAVGEGFAFVKEFDGYRKFSSWLEKIRGYKSKQNYVLNRELSIFEDILRSSGTNWQVPSNLFITDEEQNLLGLIKTQHIQKYTLEKHSNNIFFLGLSNKDDRKRWLSQEIIRIQSGLPLFVIVADSKNKDYSLKVIDNIVFPIKDVDGGVSEILHRYALALWTNKQDMADVLYKAICETVSTFTFYKDSENNKIIKHVLEQPLSLENKTFPNIYYKSKMVVKGEGFTNICKNMEKLLES